MRAIIVTSYSDRILFNELYLRVVESLNMFWWSGVEWGGVGKKMSGSHEIHRKSKSALNRATHLPRFLGKCSPPIQQIQPWNKFS